MEGFKCAFGKLHGIAAVWHSRAATKHLLQIRAPLKCFTESALTLVVVPRAIRQPAAVKNVTTPHNVFPASTGGYESEFSLALYIPPSLICHRIIFLMDEIVVLYVCHCCRYKGIS